MRRVFGLVLLVSASASAQSAKDIAIAEELFREGQALYAAGKASEACPKFASSYEIAGGLGTLANLARCYETIGKTASAWALYVDLKTRATRADQPERVAEAAARIAELEPRLSKLRIVLAGAAVPGLEVRHNGAPLAQATLGVAIPVDPGAHRIRVSAPGHRAFETEQRVDAEGSVVTVDVPALVPIPKAPVAAAPKPRPVARRVERPPPDVREQGSTNTTAVVGGVVGGAGVVVLGIAGGFALTARSEWNDAGCRNGICSSPGAQSLSEDANRHADTATALFITGGVLAVVGALLLFDGLSGDRAAERFFGAR
jgi:hypothetical protein